MDYHESFSVKKLMRFLQNKALSLFRQLDQHFQDIENEILTV